MKAVKHGIDENHEYLAQVTGGSSAENAKTIKYG